MKQPSLVVRKDFYNPFFVHKFHLLFCGWDEETINPTLRRGLDS